MNLLQHQTTIINFFGGPGCGKSTASMLVASKLRLRGISAEWIPEFAKDLSWRKDFKALDNQLYVSAVQYTRIRDLIGQVDYIVTDSPVLMGIVYDQDHFKGFDQVLADIHRRSKSVNIFLRREQEREYIQEGRHHTYSEAMRLDIQIEQLLIAHEVHYEIMNAHDLNTVVDYVFSRIEV